MKTQGLQELQQSTVCLSLGYGVLQLKNSGYITVNLKDALY